MAGHALTAVDVSEARREMRRRKTTAFALVAPLLAFLVFAFFAPIATMLVRSFYHPTVAELIPEITPELRAWDGVGLPDQALRARFAVVLAQLNEARQSGKLAEEANRAMPGASSMVKSSARKIAKSTPEALAAEGAELLIAADKRWGEPEIWLALRHVGAVHTPDYYLTALDLERSPSGEIRGRDGAHIYVDLYAKTLKTALIITVLALIAAYPLSFYLATTSSATANLLMVFVLLPFWTSLLVRTTAWIALLQTNGAVNSVLMYVRVIAQPLELLYTQFSTVLAMTHILLPFMVLPLYSVMKGIDPTLMRAAVSMGSKPFPAFLRVYLPLTLPGLSAGVLLVFIISVGYYITPALVGGTEGQMISNIIAFHMQQSNNWELAAALGSLLLVIILVLYWVYDRFVGAGNIKLG